MSEPDKNEPAKEAAEFVGVFRMGIKVEVAVAPDMPLTPFESREKVIHVTREAGLFHLRSPGMALISNADLLNGLWAALRA